MDGRQANDHTASGQPAPARSRARSNFHRDTVCESKFSPCTSGGQSRQTWYRTNYHAVMVVSLRDTRVREPMQTLSTPVLACPHRSTPIQTGPHPHGTRHRSVSKGTASMSKILVGPGVHEGTRSTCKTTGSPLADPVRHHERYQVK